MKQRLGAWFRPGVDAWRPDPKTVGLLVCGFSVVIAASVLVSANSVLGEVFNIPPSGFTGPITSSGLIGPFTYPVGVRVGAACAFITGCAAAFAAAGGLAIYARMPWGAALTATALGVGGAARLVNLIVNVRGVLIIEPVLWVIWTVIVICVVTGFRPSEANKHRIRHHRIMVGGSVRSRP
jgi:hypothetical protein